MIYDHPRKGVLFMQVREIKQRLDGSQQVFLCEGLLFTAEVAVLRFEATAEWALDPMTGLPHRFTEGYFWSGRTFLLYKLIGDSDAVLGYRFDVCTDVTILGDTVRWTDLLLDFWVSPDLANGTFQDEDELAEALQRGALTPERQTMVERTRSVLTSGYRQIIAEAATLRATLAAQR